MKDYMKNKKYCQRNNIHFNIIKGKNMDNKSYV